MKKLIPLALVLGALTIGIVGCPSQNSPSSPSNPPAPTNTPTVTPTPNTNIDWVQAQVTGDWSNGTLSSGAIMYLQVNGAPGSAATVLLTGTGISAPVTIPYTGNLTTAGKVCAAFSTATGFTYQPGGSYTLTTLTSAGTAAQTLSAPGPITVASNGLQASWAGGGNANVVNVYDPTFTTIYYNSHNYVNSAVSPYSIPVTAYPSSGAYGVYVKVDNLIQSINNGSGSMEVEEFDGQSVTVINITSTPTSTTTNSPTLTPTPTLTNSPTLTPTFTPTDSPTNSPTLTPSATATTTPTVTPTNTPQSWHAYGNLGFSAGPVSYVSMDVDNSLNYYVAYTDSNYNNGELVTYNGSSWSNILFNVASSGTVGFTSVAAPNSLNSYAYVGFQNATGSPNYYNLPAVKYFDTNSSTSGSLPAPPGSITNAWGEKVASYGATFFFGFQDAGSSNGWVFSYDGSAWTTVGGGPFSTNCGNQMTLYVDKSNGTPYVAFMDGNNSNYVSVEKASAGSWTNVGSAGFSGASPATSYLDNISLYTIGVTVFSAFSNGSYLQVWQNSGGSWSLVGGGSGVAAGSTAPSLAQNNGNIYVAFVDGTHSSGPSVMTYSGGTWNYVGLPAFTGSSCTYPSLLIIGGQAFLAFSDGAHSGKCSVYAYY